MKTLLLPILALLAFASQAQSPEYLAHTRRADSLTRLKQYAPAADAYRQAFASLGGKATPTDRYNAACVMSLSGQKDSAFHHLWRLAKAPTIRYSNHAHITTDADLIPLRQDPRWPVLMDSVKANKERKEVNFIKPVVAVLDSVYIDDQSTRQGIMELIGKYGQKSPQVQERFAEMRIKDSINEIKVTRILDEYGWLGPDKVGDQGSSTLFLVIQHADYPVQKKYLPMMRQAVADKKASPAQLALLEDRVALREGRKQTYGSQLITDSTGKSRLQPLEDPDNVDKRRAAVGLGPLAEYLAHFNVAWNVEEYKRTLAAEEAATPSLKKQEKAAKPQTKKAAKSKKK